MLQIESVEGNRANVLTADGGRVMVALKQAAVDTQYVEFEGVVEAPNQLKETDRAYFGSNFGEGLCWLMPELSQAACSDGCMLKFLKLNFATLCRV